MYKFNTDGDVSFSFEIEDRTDAPEWILEELEKADMPDVEDSLTIITMTVSLNLNQTWNLHDDNGKRIGSIPFMMMDVNLTYFPPENLHEDKKVVNIDMVTPDDLEEYFEICLAIQDACKEFFEKV